MAAGSGVQHRLSRVFLFHLLLISLATVMGVVGTAFVVEQVLLKQALMKEADHFWQQREDNPQRQLPDTRHMKGYMAGPGSHPRVPDALQSLEPGYRRVAMHDREPLVYVEDHGDQRLYLVFGEQSVALLAFLFGVLPLSLVLVLIYISSYLTWRKSRQLVSPLVRLADILRRSSFNATETARPDLSSVDSESNSEIAVLVTALDQYAQRLLDFVDRERQFTRDASHELRTPLAVIRSNLELLAMREEQSPALRRIQDTVEDMDAVIESLLLLARGESQALPVEDLIVNDLVTNLADRLQALARRKGVEIALEQQHFLHVRAPETLLTMVLTNLVRNAINYSGSGEVRITIGSEDILVTDEGPGMDSDQLERLMQPFERGSGTGEQGHGLGLAIVQRLCEHSGWKLELASKPGDGTRVCIRFAPQQVREVDPDDAVDEE